MITKEQQLAAAVRLARACFKSRHDTSLACCPMDRISISMTRKWEARYALRHLGKLRQAA